MMRAVLRNVVVCALLAVMPGNAQTLDEAVRGLAKRVQSRLLPADVPRVTARSLSSLGAAEVTQAKTTFERAIRRPLPRSPQPLDITLTLSQNAREYLLVADFDRNGERVVEMVEYHAARTSRSVSAALDKQLLWEQGEPMLDVAVEGDRMFVLETGALVSYARQPGGWVRVESRALQPAVVMRDPRGHLEMTGESASAFLPGQEERFTLSGTAVRFSAARNTLEAEGWPPFYSYARIEDLQLLAETDGRLHAYDFDKRPAGVYETWGSDIVATGNPCAPGLASSATDRDAADALTAFALIDRKPAPASDPLQFAGAITALWPLPGGAVAIVRNPVTEKYAAYSVTIRCSH